MSLLKEMWESYKDKAGDWLFGVALKKVAKRMIQVFVAYIASKNISKYGVEVNVETMTIALYGLLEGLRNWLKVRVGASWL